MRQLYNIGIGCFAAMAAVTLGGCLSEEPIGAETADAVGTRCAVMLTGDDAGAEELAETRANLPTGNTVHVWADEVKPSGATAYSSIQDWTLTAAASGAFTNTSGTKYFPASGNALNFYATYGNFPNFSSQKSAIFSSGVTHTIVGDQSVGATGTNYKNSDLLYACRQEELPNGSQKTVPLKFYHMTARVLVAVTTYSGISSVLDGATVKIVGGGGNVTFLPSKINETAMGTETTRTAMLNQTASNRQDVQVALATYAESGSPSSYGEGLVMPRRYQNAPLFTITLNDAEHTTLTFKPTDVTLVGGMTNVFHIHITVNGPLTLNYELQGWDTTIEQLVLNSDLQRWDEVREPDVEFTATPGTWITETLTSQTGYL